MLQNSKGDCPNSLFILIKSFTFISESDKVVFEAIHYVVVAVGHPGVCLWDPMCVCPHACLSHFSVCSQYGSMISCHLSPPTSPLPPSPSLLLQRKPAIQSGAEFKSIGVWPGSRPLAKEVVERQPKSLPLGLYCLYRGLVIGGYSSSIKRLLPQPLRRVRHSLPPSSTCPRPPIIPIF